MEKVPSYSTTGDFGVTVQIATLPTQTLLTVSWPLEIVYCALAALMALSGELSGSCDDPLPTIFSSLDQFRFFPARFLVL